MPNDTHQPPVHASSDSGRDPRPRGIRGGDHGHVRAPRRHHVGHRLVGPRPVRAGPAANMGAAAGQTCMPSRAIARGSITNGLAQLAMGAAFDAAGVAGLLILKAALLLGSLGEPDRRGVGGRSRGRWPGRRHRDIQCRQPDGRAAAVRDTPSAGVLRPPVCHRSRGSRGPGSPPSGHGAALRGMGEPAWRLGDGPGTSRRVGGAWSGSWPGARPNRLGSAAAGVAAVLATLLNPYGVGLWQFLWDTVGFARPDIVEWQSLDRLPVLRSPGRSRLASRRGSC